MILNFKSTLMRKMWCILTNQWVLHTQFTGGNHLFRMFLHPKRGCLGVTPKRWWVDPLFGIFSIFWRSFSSFLLFFDRKTTENTEKCDFVQRRACEAPVCWSKYTTERLFLRKSKIGTLSNMWAYDTDH